MKIAKPNYRYIPIYHLITLMIALSIFLVPNHVAQILSLHWFWLLPCLLAVMLPSSKTPIGQSPGIPFLQWLLAIIGICLSSYLLFISISQNFWQFVEPQNTHQITTNLQQLFSYRWALFPWPLCALCASLLAIHYYHDGQRDFSYPLRIISTRFFSHPQVVTAIGAGLSIATTIIIAITVALPSINYSQAILQQFHLSLYQDLSPPAFIIIFVLSLLPATQVYRTTFKNLSTKSIGVGIYYALFIIVCIILLTITNMGMRYFEKLQPQIDQYQLMLTPYLNHRSTTFIYTIFYNCWLFAWCPLAISLIAKISKGRQLRTVIITLLGVSTSLTIIFGQLLQHGYLTNMVVQYLSIIGLLIFLLAQCWIKSYSEQIYNFIPDKNPRRIRLKLIMDKILHISLSVVITLLIFHHYLIDYVLFILVIPSLLVLPLNGLSLCYFLSKSNDRRKATTIINTGPPS